jgi:hypothetical protein
MRALLVVSLLIVSVANADAQDVPERRDYYSERAAISCQGPQTFCALQFPTISVRTLITRVSCVIITSGTLRTVTLEDASRSPNARQSEPLAVNTEPVVYNGNWYSTNWSADFLLMPGAVPAISIDSFPAGSNTISCTISGRRAR